MSELVLYLSSPPSINRAYANGGKARGRIKTKEAYDWIDIASSELAIQKRWTIEPPYEVVYSYRKKGNYRADAFNFEKLLSDFLVKCNIMKDDCLIDRGTVEWSKDESLKPGTCKIIIRSLA